MANTTEYIEAYYIDQRNGSDDNLGTRDSPLRTIQKGVNVAAENNNDGNKIYLTDGIHYLNKTLEINQQSGTSGSPLTIQPAPGASVIVDGHSVSDSRRGLIEIKDANHVDIKGLEIRNSPNHGIEVINGDYIDIYDNLVYDTRGMGIRVRGYIPNSPYESDTTVQSTNVKIEGNGVYKTNLSNGGANKGKANWGAAIQAWNADDVTIVNNTVGENYGEGIGLSLVDDGKVANNIVYDNYSVQVYLDNVTDSEVEANFIFDGGDRRFHRFDLPANGIAMANEVHNVANPEKFYLNNNTITRNVIVNSNTGIVYGTWGGIHQSQSENWRGLKNTDITHNTVYNPEFNAVRFYPDFNVSNVNIAHNIFHQDSGGGSLADIDDLTGINFTRNLWSGGDPVDGSTPSDIMEDPQLVNAGGYSIADYRLRSNSAAIDAVNYSSDSFVTDGQADLGALEFGQPAFATGGFN